MRASLVVITLTVSVLAFSTETFFWKPYSFKAYERYDYRYRETLKGKKGEATYRLEIKRKDGLEILIKGRYRKWKGVIRKNFKNVYELSGFILMRMYFDHYWLIPLGRTLFSRGLVRVLTSKEIDWKLGRKKVDKDTVRIVRSCRFGGLEGRMMEVKKKGVIVFGLCASPKASLPIYFFRKVGEDSFEIKLEEYSDLK